MPMSDGKARSTTPEFWRGYRVEAVGETVYLENEAGVEAFTEEQAEAYALAILAEIHGGDADE